jgi:hypothetical protein
MPTMCHWITRAAVSKGWLCATMAKGVAVMTRFMAP